MSFKSEKKSFYNFIVMQKEDSKVLDKNILYESFVEKFKIKLSSKTTLNESVIMVLNLLLQRKNGRNYCSNNVTIDHLIENITHIECNGFDFN